MDTSLDECHAGNTRGRGEGEVQKGSSIHDFLTLKLVLIMAGAKAADGWQKPGTSSMALTSRVFLIYNPKP
jgi:hypothetical protein